MEEIKQKINLNLVKLNEIKPIKYTASDLHRQTNHLLNRVQRKEDQRYFKNVEVQKKKLLFDLGNIDMYEQRLQFEKDRRANVINQWALNRAYTDELGNIKIIPPQVFQDINRVVPKPEILINNNPALIRVRSEVRRNYRRSR
jgi:hypothetical protein